MGSALLALRIDPHAHAITNSVPSGARVKEGSSCRLPQSREILFDIDRHFFTMASTLDTILKKHTAGEETSDKVLGASFIVVNKDGNH